MKNFYVIFILSALALLSACDNRPDTSSDSVQRRQQEQISAQGNSAVGMPAIVNFQEKRMMKQILELRDKAITTITYTQDMNGNLHKLCDSVGYGLPYSTQYTNPQKVQSVSDQHGIAMVAVAQADPNGLFSPASANGTWILCSDGKGKTAPVYAEPNVIVSPFPLKSEK